MPFFEARLSDVIFLIFADVLQDLLDLIFCCGTRFVGVDIDERMQKKRDTREDAEVLAYAELAP
jgi:hypothetical protein